MAVPNYDKNAIEIDLDMGVQWTDITLKELILGESLTTPGLQMSATFQSEVYLHGKNLDELKGKDVSLYAYSGHFSDFRRMQIGAQMKVYRLENRRLFPDNMSKTQEFTVHCCDESLLENGKHLMSKSWQCKTPSDIVKDALKCVKAEVDDIQSSEPARTYIAENIHPFQVIAQQANAALDGEDPSFVHFMKFLEVPDQRGKHYFKSLKELAKQSPVWEFFQSETTDSKNQGYQAFNDQGEKKSPAIVFEFPCDFDLLSDILNGVGADGMNMNTMTTWNPFNLNFSFFQGEKPSGNSMQGCYEGYNLMQSMTNKGAEDDPCKASNIDKYLLKRQARMGLLDKNKVALRLTVPWNPRVHAGDVIRFTWKNHTRGGGDIYGSGDYLVASTMHKIYQGGFGVTTLDCVASTVERGEV